MVSVFGLALSVGRTVGRTRVLADNNDLRSPTGRIAIGWLVLEDERARIRAELFHRRE